MLPLYAPGHLSQGAILGAGYGLGDGLRRFVGTPDAVLRAPGPIGVAETLRLAPAVRTDDLRGAMRGWDGQLIDDARLVVAVARTAAGYGASVLTRVEALEATGDSARLRDTLTGQETHCAGSCRRERDGGVDGGTRSRRAPATEPRARTWWSTSARLGGSDVSLTVPVPGSRSRFVFTLPTQHGRTYIGLTDVPADGPIPDVPHATEAEIDMLLEVVSSVLAEPLTRADVIGTYAGLRPLLTSAHDDDETSDLSRKHAILESADGVLSVVGGKLTTYRRMAQDGIDEAVRRRILPAARPSVTRTLPLVGAWPRDLLRGVEAPARLVRRYGAEAPYAAALPDGPGAARGVTAQELQWGVAVEGALSIDDLLDRRTRLGLVAADREQSTDAAAAAFERAGVEPVTDRGQAERPACPGAPNAAGRAGDPGAACGGGSD